MIYGATSMLCYFVSFFPFFPSVPSPLISLKHLMIPSHLSLTPLKCRAIHTSHLSPLTHVFHAYLSHMSRPSRSACHASQPRLSLTSTSLPLLRLGYCTRVRALMQLMHTHPFDHSTKLLLVVHRSYMSCHQCQPLIIHIILLAPTPSLQVSIFRITLL